eukprot:7199930-Prymnesium_polylepis.1
MGIRLQSVQDGFDRPSFVRRQPIRECMGGWQRKPIRIPVIKLSFSAHESDESPVPPLAKL